jgi:hypothetical protein
MLRHMNIAATPAAECRCTLYTAQGQTDLMRQRKEETMELTTATTVQPSLTCQQQVSTSGSTQMSQTQLAAKSETRHLEMNLVTAEGDKVTLSFDSQSMTLMAGYQEAGSSSEGSYTRQGYLSARTFERSMSLTVEGDLNDQEKKDIRKVIHTLKKMMHHFVSDKIRPMMAKAQKLGKLDTVAGLDIEMSYSRQTLAAEQQQISTTYNQQGQVTAPQEETPAPVENTPTWDDVASQADTLTDAMARQMSSVQAFIDRMQGSIRKIFDDFRQQMAALNPDDNTGPALIADMHENFLAKVLEQASPAKDAQAA